MPSVFMAAGLDDTSHTLTIRNVGSNFDVDFVTVNSTLP